MTTTKTPVTWRYLTQDEPWFDFFFHDIIITDSERSELHNDENVAYVESVYMNRSFRDKRLTQQ